MTGFFDIHSHLVPGVDDGVEDLDLARAVLERMRESGTRRLWATPHIAEAEGYSAEESRLALIAERFAQLDEILPKGLTVQLGYELTPSPSLLEADLTAFALDGLGVALIDGPEDEPAAHHDLILPCVLRALEQGLLPVVAHPERRADPAHPTSDPGFAARHASAGALLQVDACSLLDDDGPEVRAEAWRLVEGGLACLIASDAHGIGEATDLARAHAAIAERVDRQTADRLCGGEIELLSQSGGRTSEGEQ